VDDDRAHGTIADGFLQHGRIVECRLLELSRCQDDFDQTILLDRPRVREGLRLLPHDELAARLPASRSGRPGDEQDQSDDREDPFHFFAPAANSSATISS
jgi:hypothetical protein